MPLFSEPPVISCMLQDEKGAMYYASNKGLIMYNGIQWKWLNKQENLKHIAYYPKFDTLLFAVYDNAFGFFSLKDF
ncbi:MAG: hypothetical protein HC896_08135 [Bacteroidales bacterium]|nr:hypothetical protein [Bacteroidales bacterium]